MIPSRQILGCLHCGNIDHINTRYRTRCPHCEYGLNYAQMIAWRN